MFWNPIDRVATVSEVTPGAHEIIVIVESPVNDGKGPQKLGDTYPKFGS